MNNPLGVSPSKGNQGTTRGKEKRPVGYSWVQLALKFTLES